MSNTATQAIALLDVLTLDELKALTDEELRRFEALLSHWQQLAQGERKRSEDPARQPQATNDLSVAVRLAWVWASRRDIT